MLIKFDESYQCFRAQWNTYSVQLLFARPLMLRKRYIQLDMFTNNVVTNVQFFIVNGYLASVL